MGSENGNTGKWLYDLEQIPKDKEPHFGIYDHDDGANLKIWVGPNENKNVILWFPLPPWQTMEVFDGMLDIFKLMAVRGSMKTKGVIASFVAMKKEEEKRLVKKNPTYVPFWLDFPSSFPFYVSDSDSPDK